MATILQTNILEITRAVKARLVALEVVGDESQVVIAARREMPHIKGKLDIVLKPRRETQLQTWAQGGNRLAMVFVRTIDVFVRTSYAGTELSDDEGWFAEHVPVEDAVINALAGQMLTDNANNDFLTCPMNYLGSAEENKEANLKAANLWGDSQHSFEFHFRPKLNLTQET